MPRLKLSNRQRACERPTVTTLLSFSNGCEMLRKRRQLSTVEHFQNGSARHSPPALVEHPAIEEVGKIVSARNEGRKLVGNVRPAVPADLSIFSRGQSHMSGEPRTPHFSRLRRRSAKNTCRFLVERLRPEPGPPRRSNGNRLTTWATARATSSY